MSMTAWQIIYRNSLSYSEWQNLYEAIHTFLSISFGLHNSEGKCQWEKEGKIPPHLFGLSFDCGPTAIRPLGPLSAGLVFQTAVLLCVQKASHVSYQSWEG